MGSCHSEQRETMQVRWDTSSPLPILTSWLLTGWSITSLNEVIFTLSFFWGLACIGCFCASIIIAVATSVQPNVVLCFYFESSWFAHVMASYITIEWCRIYSSFRAYCYSVSLLAPNSVLQTNDQELTPQVKWLMKYTRQVICWRKSTRPSVNSWMRPSRGCGY